MLYKIIKVKRSVVSEPVLVLAAVYQNRIGTKKNSGSAYRSYSIGLVDKASQWSPGFCTFYMKKFETVAKVVKLLGIL